MPVPNDLPPLPSDADERTYVLAAVRGALQWLPSSTGHQVDLGHKPHRTLIVYVPMVAE